MGTSYSFARDSASLSGVSFPSVSFVSIGLMNITVLESYSNATRGSRVSHWRIFRNVRQLSAALLDRRDPVEATGTVTEVMVVVFPTSSDVGIVEYKLRKLL